MKTWRLSNVKRFPIDVVIHDTVEDVRKHAKLSDCYAACYIPGRRNSPIEVHVPLNIGISHIAHECVHVAQALRRRGCVHWYKWIDGDAEEELAYPVGELTQWVHDVIQEERRLRQAQGS